MVLLRRLAVELRGPLLVHLHPGAQLVAQPQLAHGGGIALLRRLDDRGIGVEQDMEEAARLYRRCAEEDYPKGQFLLGQSYELGQGVERDPALAGEGYGRLGVVHLHADAPVVAEAQIALGGDIAPLRRLPVKLHRPATAPPTSRALRPPPAPWGCATTGASAWSRTSSSTPMPR